MKFITESNIENIPSDFFKIITDFANDICRVFPEYNSIINKYILSETEKSDDSKLKLYNFVGKVIIQNEDYIVSKKESLFVNTDGTGLNTEFLPRIVFSHIWEGDISEITKNTIWKYLTLLYVTISKQQNGDTNSIDLDEILSGILLDEQQPEAEAQPQPQSPEETSQSDTTNMPDISALPEQLKNMMGGSLGKLAMELAQETSKDGGKSPMDLFSMMGKIGNKIENKLKSGELSENSLLEESMGLINSMGGVNNIQSMMNMFKGGKGGFDFSELQKMTQQQGSHNDNQDDSENTETQPFQKKGMLYDRHSKNSQKSVNKKVRQKLRGNNPRNMTDTNNEQAPEYTLPRFTDDELEHIFSSK
jgi:hypothetical protein